jgi:hypothetical protein
VGPGNTHCGGCGGEYKRYPVWIALSQKSLLPTLQIFDKALGERFDSLIHQPLQKVGLPPHGCATLVVVVDALDECEKERDIEVTPGLWSLQKSQAFVMAHLAKMDVWYDYPEAPGMSASGCFRETLLRIALICTQERCSEQRLRQQFRSWDNFGCGCTYINVGTWPWALIQSTDLTGDLTVVVGNKDLKIGLCQSHTSACTQD